MLAQAMQYLNQNRILHIDMIEPLRRGSGSILRAGTDGVLIFDRLAALYLVSAETAPAAAEMAALMTEPKLAAAHQEHTAKTLAEIFGLRRTMCCYQAMWDLSVPPAVPESDLELRLLTPDLEAEILSNYSHDIGRDYIRGRILAGEMTGAFDDGELAGFIGLHEEGSMGMLEVKPAYRRRGIASLLLASLSASQLALGRIPFSQFVRDNIQSRKLHEQLGFTISNECVYWLER